MLIAAALCGLALLAPVAGQSAQAPRGAPVPTAQPTPDRELPPAELLDLLGAAPAPELALTASAALPVLGPICWTPWRVGLAWRTAESADWLVLYRRRPPYGEAQRPALVDFWHPAPAGRYRTVDSAFPELRDGYFLDSFNARPGGGWARTATAGPYVASECLYFPMVGNGEHRTYLPLVN